MPNPDHLGEYSKLYYQITDYDITDSGVGTVEDSAILADGSWIELCVVDVNVTRARDLREVIDRCVGDEKEYTGGKRETSVSVNINELRLTPEIIKGWQAISDTSAIIALLILNDDRTETEAYGLVGNFLVEQDDDTQPAEGNNTNALTYRPAARSAYDPKIRRVYGSGNPGLRVASAPAPTGIIDDQD